MFKTKTKPSLSFLGFLQAFGLVAYCLLVALFFYHANSIFGPIDNFLAPLLLLTLFVVSALICGLIVLGRPILLVYKHKKPLLATLPKTSQEEARN